MLLPFESLLRHLGLAESNGMLADCQEPGSAPEPYAR